MNLKSEWCGGKASTGENTVLGVADGSRAIEIMMTPAVECKECEMLYQNEEVIKEIEDQLFLVDTKKIGSSISFEELMGLPRLLKRKYSDFSS